MYYVYMLRCEGNTIYTGFTTDVYRRFVEHTEGIGAKYTRTHKPVKIECIFAVTTKSEALKLEYSIKKIGRPNKEKLIAGELDINEILDMKIERISV